MLRWRICPVGGACRRCEPRNEFIIGLNSLRRTDKQVFVRGLQIVGAQLPQVADERRRVHLESPDRRRKSRTNQLADLLVVERTECSDIVRKIEAIVDVSIELTDADVREGPHTPRPLEVVEVAKGRFLANEGEYRLPRSKARETRPDVRCPFAHALAKLQREFDVAHCVVCAP